VKIKLVFIEKEEEKFIGVKPECSDLYFCISNDHNNKTPHLLSRLMSCPFNWIATYEELRGTVTLEKWLEVGGKVEKWLLEKTKEFEFLMNYERNRHDS
jgi:hypothetical protein